MRPKISSDVTHICKCWEWNHSREDKILLVKKKGRYTGFCLCTVGPLFYTIFNIVPRDSGVFDRAGYRRDVRGLEWLAKSDRFLYATNSLPTRHSNKRWLRTAVIVWCTRVAVRESAEIELKGYDARVGTCGGRSSYIFITFVFVTRQKRILPRKRSTLEFAEKDDPERVSFLLHQGNERCTYPYYSRVCRTSRAPPGSVHKTEAGSKKPGPERSRRQMRAW